MSVVDDVRAGELAARTARLLGRWEAKLALAREAYRRARLAMVGAHDALERERSPRAWAAFQEANLAFGAAYAAFRTARTRVGRYGGDPG